MKLAEVLKIRPTKIALVVMLKEYICHAIKGLCLILLVVALALAVSRVSIQTMKGKINRKGIADISAYCHLPLLRVPNIGIYTLLRVPNIGSLAGRIQIVSNTIVRI